MPGDRLPPSNGSPKQQYAESKIAGEGAISANAEVVNLEEEAEREGLSVADRIALQDANLRTQMANRIIGTLVIGHTVTLVALFALVWFGWTKQISRAISSSLAIASLTAR